MITQSLHKIMEHAYSTVPYYMDLMNNREMVLDDIEKLEKLPIIDKDTLVKKNDSFISAKYLSLFLQEKLLKVHTSGSTGKCVNIFWCREEIIRSLLPLWIRRKKYYQINPHDKHCYFFTGRNLNSSDIEMENRGFAVGFCKSNLNEKKLIWIWEKMKEFEPRWMNLQPSMATLLCKVIEKHNLCGIPTLHYIETTGEILFPEIRKKIEDILHVKVVDQYGCNEMNSIAFECPEGHLHCLDDNVFVEVLDGNEKQVEDGCEGEICITTLNNLAMPLVRYKIGDRGKLIENTCSCCEKGKILILSTGRSNDWVIDNNGEKLNAYIFARCVENVNAIYEHAILQFQVIQKAIGDYIIRLVIDDDWEGYEIQKLFLESLWQPSLSGSKFQFEFYTKLFPDENCGKLKWFISDVQTTEEYL